MMAHEIPIQVRQAHPPSTKTNKHKPVIQPVRQLPNGEKPDFGHGSREKPTKGKQQLPNKEKPNFGPEQAKSTKSAKKLKKKNSAQVNSASNSAETTKVNNNTNNNNNSASLNGGNSKSVKKGEDSYAGSSFHSSPAALALPKPSFKASPKPAAAPLQSPVQTNVHTGPTGLNMPPAFVYQGMPPSGPPRYPVTAYPPSGPYHPGFNYNANPQGFINYLYPPSAVPQPPIPMQSYPLGPPPVQQYPQQFHAPQQPQAQKITFNELLGSSK